MRKVIISLVVITVILILLIFAWPFIMGTSLRSQLYDIQKQGLPGDVKVHVLADHVGWLHSQADLLINIPDRDDPIGRTLGVAADKKLPKERVVRLHLNISAGPIAYLEHSLSGRHFFWGRGAAIGTAKLVSPDPAEFPHLPSLQKPTRVEVRWTWRGDIHLLGQRQPGALYRDDNIQVADQGIQTRLSITSNFQQFSGSTQVNNLVTKNNDVTLHVSRINGQYQIKRGAAGLWYGHGSLNIPSVSLVKHDVNLMQLHTVQYDESVSLDKHNNMMAKAQLSIQHTSIAGEEAGPFNAELSAHNLRPQAVADIRKKLRTLKQPKPLPKNISDEKRQVLLKQRAKQLFQQVQPSIVSVLTGVQFNVDTLQLKTDKGTASFNGSLEFPQEIPGAVTDPHALNNIVKAAEGKAKLTLPVTLAKQLEGAVSTPESQSQSSTTTPLQRLVNEGWLKQQADNYVTNFDYKDGKISANGKQVFPPLQPKKSTPSKTAEKSDATQQKTNSNVSHTNSKSVDKPSSYGTKSPKDLLSDEAF